MGKTTTFSELTKRAESFGLSYKQVVESSHDDFYKLIFPFNMEERETLITVRRKGKNRVRVYIHTYNAYLEHFSS